MLSVTLSDRMERYREKHSYDLLALQNPRRANRTDGVDLLHQPHSSRDSFNDLPAHLPVQAWELQNLTMHQLYYLLAAYQEHWKRKKKHHRPRLTLSNHLLL